jgi:hypothetical protein
MTRYAARPGDAYQGQAFVKDDAGTVRAAAAAEGLW